MSRALNFTQMQSIIKLHVDLGVDCFLSDHPQSRYEEEQSDHKKIDTKFIPVMKKQNTAKKTPTAHDMVRHLVANITSLDELRKAVENYDGLEIKKGANKIVFGDGNQQSDIMLIGEAPGAEEDKQGIPFCGQSGKLLANILAAINLDRSKYYITNTVFWRPPANRRPTPEEIHVCRPFVEKHIALVRPKVIVLVGSTAVESLLHLQSPMGELRKKVFSYSNEYLTEEISTFVIYHPSYLLRQAKQKKLMYHDVLKINAAL